MNLTAEQTKRIEEILKQWHEARRSEFEKDYSNLDYDSPAYAKTYRVGEKYIHLLDGTSGAFMVEIETGTVYEIKGWGVPNKKKIAGEAWKPTFHGAQLHDCRYIRGSYDNRSHVWVPKATAILAGILLLAASARCAEKALYRTHRLSVADVAVSCADGGRPVVQEVATDKRVIIVSCPFEAEEKAPRGTSWNEGCSDGKGHTWAPRADGMCYLADR